MLPCQIMGTNIKKESTASRAPYTVVDKTLALHIRNGKIAQSYLLIDKDIIKLKAIANWFAENFNTADVFKLEGSPTITVKETEAFLGRTHLAAVAEKKLYTVCDMSTMTPAAQNKMLKTIEDTTNDTFMLLASNANQVLNTIKSRCIIIYPDPSEPAQIDDSIIRNAGHILFDCKTLDDALHYVPMLTHKDNIPQTLLAFNELSSRLPNTKRYAILNCLARINRNINSNCNAQNIFDTLLITIFLK